MGSEIAAVVNLHREGAAANRSIISAWRACARARKNGVEADLYLVLDDSDAETASLARRWMDRGARLIACAEGDLGAARNAAANAIDAEWFAFLDSDDLWGERWLLDAHAHAATAADSEPLDVWHPEVSVVFGDHHSLIVHLDSTDPRFSWARLRLHNGWTALSVVRRSTLLHVPYPRNRLTEGYGFEDWSWNVEILRRGGRHRIVPASCHFIRRRLPTDDATGSLLQKSTAALRSPYPTPVTSTTPLPGATTAVSEPSEVDHDLPPTHQHRRVDLSPPILAQARLASTIEPEIAATLAGSRSASLPQNTNTHVTEPQRALEDIELRLASSPVSLGEVLDDSMLLAQLDPVDRDRVVAEVILDPRNRDLPRGTSEHLVSARRRYPQLPD